VVPVRRLPSACHGHKIADHGGHTLQVFDAPVGHYGALVDLRELLLESEVRFIVGKGGVGKTTITSAFALAAAASGLRAHIIELEGRDELLRCFDAEGSLDFTSRVLYTHESGGEVSARHLGADEALLEWLRDHGFSRLLSRLRSSGALEVIATAIPGIRDVLILGKIKALARDQIADVILVDSPATGHSLSLLAAPASMSAAARSGPIRRQAEEVSDMLHDEKRCSVTLVTLAGELPVSEAVEAAFELEDRAGVALSALVVNQFEGANADLRLPLSASERDQLSPAVAASVEAARQFSLARGDEQERQRDRLSEQLPLNQLVVSRIDVDAITLDGLMAIATQLLEGTGS
jgi:anion-transporting  ArsA/GET3 family ATPase